MLIDIYITISTEVLYLLPDSGDAQEGRWPAPLEVVNETSLHHVFVRKVSAALQDDGGVDVKHLASHVAQRQIAQNSEISLLQTVVPDGHLGGPDDVVMGEHHPLGVPRGAGGVDQRGALVDGDTAQSGFQTGIIQAVSSVEKILRYEVYRVPRTDQTKCRLPSS